MEKSPESQSVSLPRDENRQAHEGRTCLCRCACRGVVFFAPWLTISAVDEPSPVIGTLKCKCSLVKVNLVNYAIKKGITGPAVYKITPEEPFVQAHGKRWRLSNSNTGASMQVKYRGTKK